MGKTEKLKYIIHSEIDETKWNRCIDEALNSRIYAFSWQLDRAASTWDALVLGDYEYVMPLPIRKKMGLKYLYHPLFSQQLGIFPASKHDISKLFYDYLAIHFRYANLQLNSGNLPAKGIKHTSFLQRKNYLLPLGTSYQNIETFFSTNTRRNIIKAKKNRLTVVKGIRLDAYLDFKTANLPPGVSKADVQTLKNIIAYGQYKGFGEIYGVYNSDNELCAAVYFCRWKDRVIYFNAVSNEKGKNLGGMYFLLHHFIEQNAGKNLTLDFEGSMIPGVERFYMGFGATPETYFLLKINRLPLPLRWIKS